MKKTIKKAAYSKSSAMTEAAGKSAENKMQEAVLSLKKQYLKSSPACKVTFRLPKEAAPDAKMVTVVGDFNNWNLSETHMKKLKSGDFTATLELPCNREYRFKYLVDSNRWENDWCADRYAPNEFGTDDSVVVIGGDGN